MIVIHKANTYIACNSEFHTFQIRTCKDVKLCLHILRTGE